MTGNLIAQLFEWTIVATGLFTTILISVKSFASPRSRGFFSMAVMAIVLSSFGTAVATLNSFYTPRLAYDKTERSLASLRQLHGTLAGGLMRERAACAEKDGWTGWRQRQIRDLTNTFLAITSTASRLSGSPDDESAVNPAANMDPRAGKQTPTGAGQAQEARSEGRR